MSEKTTCMIVGGGPAGMIAGLLLARGGVDVTVLEKHADFLRDFRGDTVHPSTLRLLDELGLFEQFDALPHTKLTGWGLDLPDGRKAPVIDFTRLRLPHRYIAMVPQWDLLDLLAEAGANGADVHPADESRRHRAAVRAGSGGRRALRQPRWARRTARRPHDRLRRALVAVPPRGWARPA